MEAKRPLSAKTLRREEPASFCILRFSLTLGSNVLSDILVLYAKRIKLDLKTEALMFTALMSGDHGSPRNGTGQGRASGFGDDTGETGSKCGCCH